MFIKSDSAVTISVLTYNSSKYVLETLESIKAQTYQPLILQICDDCSTDDTIKISKRWIEQNKNRFLRTKIIIPEHNTGISGNVNRCNDACETEWCKGIAGDDILKPECVEEYMNYVSEHPGAVVVFSRIEPFGPKSEIVKQIKKFTEGPDSFFCMSTKEQYDSLIMNGNSILAPTLFHNVRLLRELNIRADERFPMLDDYPMWLNLTKKNVKLHFIDKTLVRYRVGEGGLSTENGINLKFQESLRMFYFYYIFPALSERDLDLAIKRFVDYELSLLRDIQTLQNSPSYLLGSFILKPIKLCINSVKRFLLYLKGNNCI